uniref:Amidase domain-containing protein n=1 Tax=Schistocephalus solidus TaxID=70667 RepID=A0A0V0JDH8_SCHSO
MPSALPTTEGNAQKKREKKIKELAAGKQAFAVYLAQHPMKQEEIDHITQIPYLELIERIKSEELPRAYVLLAYQHKAFQVDKEVNCVVEFLKPDLSKVNLSGPLAGAPVSLKECVSLKGLDNCAGCSILAESPRSADAVALQIILDLGGVPFVRTTVPQTMMSVLCSNPITGITVNPLDHTRSPGGSSGGEAALISGGGSQLGFGTDLGGSIRIPAAMCGIVGFKPTTGRLSNKNLSPMTTKKMVLSSWGPMCKDVAVCSLVMKHIINCPVQFKEDPDTPPVPYTEPQEGRKLRIGYFTDLDCFVANPAVRRAVLHAKEKLAKRGHELVEWRPPFSGLESLRMFLKALFADGGASMLNLLRYDEVDPCVRGTYQLFSMSRFRKMWTKLLMVLTGNWETLCVIQATDGLGSVAAQEALAFQISQFKARFFEAWRQAGLDVVLSPMVGHAAALPIRPPHAFTSMLSFANLANLLGLPAGSLPSGLSVERSDLEKLRHACAGSLIIPDAADKTEAAYYDDYGSRSPTHYYQFPLQEGTEGLPIAVQISALPWQDELCLYAMSEVEAAVRT